jgi:hypothetical protein
VAQEREPLCTTSVLREAVFERKSCGAFNEVA